MRAILSLSVVCLLTAVWTLVLLWMIGVLPAREERVDFPLPAAPVPEATPPGGPVAQETLGAEPGTVTVVKVTRGGRDAAQGRSRASAVVAARLEGPRLPESVLRVANDVASPPLENVTAKGTRAEDSAAEKAAAERPVGASSAGKNEREPTTPSAVEAADAETSSAAAESEPEPEPEPEVEVEVVPCVCSGRVLTAHGGLPLAGYLVELDLGPEVLRVTTDALGAFTLGVGTSAPEGFALARVREPAGDLVHFVELLPGADVEFLVRPVERLSGRLETRPPADYAGLRVAVILPAVEGLRPELLLGSTALDAQGHFLLEVTEPCPTDGYRLRFHRGDATLVAAAVSRDLLLDDEALIQVALARLEVHVRDLAGVAISGARVHLVRFGAGAFDTGGSVEPATEGSILCDARGRASAELQTGAWEMCVSAPGYAPRVLERDLPSGQVTSRIEACLQRLGAEDLVRGQVLSARGKPVAGAWVTARPPSRSAALTEQVATATRTDAKGRFELPLELDALTVLEAEHPLHGRVEQSPIAPGFRAASLRFRPRYPLKVGVVLGEAGGPALGGVVLYALIDRAGELCASGTGEAPLIVQGLEIGEYELFVASPRAGAGGRRAVRVTAPDRGNPARGTIRLDAWPTTQGVVLDAEGAPLPGLIVVADMGDWPAAIAFECGRTVTDGAGRFQLRVPTQGPLTVRVQEGARVLLTATIDAGQEGLLTVR
ncbi:MAG: hypothetical protein V3T22_02790 [Planctomycetota bacterium]